MATLKPVSRSSPGAVRVRVARPGKAARQPGHCHGRRLHVAPEERLQGVLETNQRRPHLLRLPIWTQPQTSFTAEIKMVSITQT